MMPDIKFMSREEQAFVKLYTVTLKREYDLFMSVLSLMSSHSLALKCPVQAARVAQELQGFHADFDSALASLANAHGLRSKTTTDEHPTPAELVRLVQISFFKLVKSATKNEQSADKGWFSGHPFDWKKEVEKTPPFKVDNQFENAMTALFAALYKLFNNTSQAADFKLPSDLYGGPTEFEAEDEYCEDGDDDFLSDDFDAPH